MKRFVQRVSVILLCGMLVTPVVAAQDRGRGGSSQRHERTENNRQSGNRDRNDNKNDNKNNDRGRDQGNKSNPGQGKQDRPNNSTPNRDQGNRPGGNQGRPNNNNRPGGQPGRHDYNPGRPQPGQPGHHGYHGPVTPRPNSEVRHHSNYYNPTPQRPFMPAHHPFRRPTPPPPGAHYYGSPLFNTILGVTLGTALNASLDYLIGASYNVAGYADNVVYVNNASMMGYSWPNATLYYTDNVMSGSEFVYSTTAYDVSRFNYLYNSLNQMYGAPVSIDNDSDLMSSTWWSYDQYITLSYYPDYATNGTLRYYTVLTMGR